MTHWSIALAKKNLSKVIEKTKEGPQVITNRGKIVAYLVRPQSRDEALVNQETGQSLVERLMALRDAHQGGFELKTPARQKEKLVNPFEG